uniref:Sirohydrochlorin ferrochelatase n=1 Tax=Oryza punctata TaxID=4537 RepID=A0A0E0JYR6_ORYPU
MVPRWRGIGGVAVGVRDRDGSTCNGRGAWGAERGAVEPWKGGIERARREGNNRGSAQQCDLGITQRSSVDKGEEDHGTIIIASVDDVLPTAMGGRGSYGVRERGWVRGGKAEGEDREQLPSKWEGEGAMVCEVAEGAVVGGQGSPAAIWIWPTQKGARGRRVYVEELEKRSIDVRNSASFVKLPRIGLNIGNIVMSAKPNSGSSSETTQGESCTVGEKDGVIIVDHGSRREESNLMLNDFVAMFRVRTGYKIVEPAHMELAEPAIKDAFGKCVQQGASRVIVSPYFLSPGRHWKQDIPALAAEASKEHSNIPYIVTAPLGLHELMVDVMNDRIKYCLRHVAGDVEECTVCAGTGKCHLYP